MAAVAWRRNSRACQGLPSLRLSGLLPPIALTFAGGLALAVLGCATSGGDRRTPATAGAAAAAGTAVPAAKAAASAPGQWLFRAEISGEEGSGSVRLLLRRRDGDRFTLAASDAVGQARWEIRREADGAIWYDPQAKLFCRLDPHLPVRARLALPGIRLADLPGLLTGEWPPADRVAESPDPASDERPFTGERRAAEVAEASGGGNGAGGNLWQNWTLWEAGEPVAWFKRLEAESLLSVRRPAVQVRWRVSARGNLKAAPDDGAAPATPDGLDDLPAGVRERICPDNEIP